MNNKSIILAAFAILCGAAFSQAQNPPPQGGPQGGPPPGMPGGQRPGGLLTPDEQKALVGAVQKARQSDNVKALFAQQQELNKKIDEAMSEAVVAADPSLAGVVEKLKQARAAGGGQPSMNRPAATAGKPNNVAPASSPKPAGR